MCRGTWLGYTKKTLLSTSLPPLLPKFEWTSSNFQITLVFWTFCKSSYHYVLRASYSTRLCVPKISELEGLANGYTGRMRVRSCPRRGITGHEKEEQIDSQPSLVLDWKLSRSQNIDQPTELKGVLLYKRRWKPLPFRITRILGMMRLFFLQHRYLYISSFYPMTNGIPVYLIRSVFLVKVRQRHLYTISQGSVLAKSPTPYLWAS